MKPDPRLSSAEPYRGTVVSPGKVVPLISSYVAGPLGIAHLPRLWLKALLHAKNILAEDWGCGPGGLDKRLMHAVGIDVDGFMDWLMRELPTYPESEAWVAANATNLTPEAIVESNKVMYTLGLPRDLGPQFRSFMRLDDSIDVGIMLNNYDDWHTAHHLLTTTTGGRRDKMVPAISPQTTGWSGIQNLPRQWLKDTLATLDALPSGYPEREDADDAVLRVVGIDPAAARRHISNELPTYVDYERWIGTHALHSSETIVWGTIPGLGIEAVEARHVGDWLLLHASIVARAMQGTGPLSGVLAFDISGRLRP